jgi:hypothetical protein
MLKSMSFPMPPPSPPLEVNDIEPLCLLGIFVSPITFLIDSAYYIFYFSFVILSGMLRGIVDNVALGRNETLDAEYFGLANFTFTPLTEVALLGC